MIRIALALALALGLAACAPAAPEAGFSMEGYTPFMPPAVGL
ncbi:MAG: hypothetical protein ACPGID_12275 [Rubricella sp.]